MTMRSANLAALTLLVALAAPGCAASPAPDPHAGRPAPADAPHGGHPAPSPDPSSRPDRSYEDADIAFMQGMIEHHRQALAMTALVPDRTENRTIRLLADRIEVSQRDEIARMARWLNDRGRAEHHGGAGDHSRMPGMLTAEQMARLESASGDEFDRLFLDFMIQHHEGALVMVADLFATPGAGQEPQIFQFASEVDSDQRMEIERMYRVRDSLGS